MGKHRKSHRKMEVYIVGYPLVMTNIAIEHGPVEIVDFPIKNGGSFHSYVAVYQRVTSRCCGTLIMW
jgi:hypothetical protein